MCPLLVRNDHFDDASTAIAEKYDDVASKPVRENLEESVRVFKVALSHVKKHYVEPKAKAKAKGKSKAKAKAAP